MIPRQELMPVFRKVQAKIQNWELDDFSLKEDRGAPLIQERLKNQVLQELKGEAELLRNRILAEYFSFGPLESLLKDPSVTEILINNFETVWIERSGKLTEFHDAFFSEVTYRNIVDRLCQRAHIHCTLENPCVEGNFETFRICVMDRAVASEGLSLSLRRHRSDPWTFDKLESVDWARRSELDGIANLVRERKNLLVVGATSTGKTSLLGALLQSLDPNERCILIEDTKELALPNKASIRFVTRSESQGQLRSLDQSELLRRALRFRPDRLIIGEMRGPEAKDFLMALSTGHAGSMGTLHATDAPEALIRLEMLIQIGAPQWNLFSVRRLIALSLDAIIVAGRNSDGARHFKSCYGISSLEDAGFTLDRLF